MSESQNTHKPTQGPWTAEGHRRVPLSEANRTNAGQETQPDDDNVGIPETFNITLKQVAQPADNSKGSLNPYAIDFEAATRVVVKTAPPTQKRSTGDGPNARHDDRFSGATGRSNPVPVQRAPRGPWFRVVLLLLMLQVLTAVAFWTPARLQEVAASTMEMLQPADIAHVRTAAGPGPLVGQLEVTSAPSGSELFVDGEPHSVTPAELVLTAGTHEVTLVSPIGTVRRKVRVRPGHRTLFSEAIFPGSLVISSAVEVKVRINGEVRIDGNSVGGSDGLELVLAPGTYQLELLKPDGDAQTIHTVEILPGQVTTLDAAARGSDA